MRRRRVIWVAGIMLCAIAWLVTYQAQTPAQPKVLPTSTTVSSGSPALTVLSELAVKGRAPKTGYARTQFGNGWQTSGGCDTRDRILQRDLTNTTLSDGCKVMSGVLNDPYTGKEIRFTRGADTSSAVQIDHVVALGDTWVTGAQNLTPVQRATLANDPLELLAVDGPANQQKSDSDAASWLPANKPFRCQYVARQIAVKKKYNLWVTSAEKSAMQQVLATCPTQAIPTGAAG